MLYLYFIWLSMTQVYFVFFKVLAVKCFVKAVFGLPVSCKIDSYFRERREWVRRADSYLEQTDHLHRFETCSERQLGVFCEPPKSGWMCLYVLWGLYDISRDVLLMKFYILGKRWESRGRSALWCSFLYISVISVSVTFSITSSLSKSVFFLCNKSWTSSPIVLSSGFTDWALEQSFGMNLLSISSGFCFCGCFLYF